MSNLSLSYSKIALIENCFGKYYFKYIKNVITPQTVWPNTLRGLVLHLILEEALKMKLSNIDNSTIIEATKGKFKKYFLQKKQDESIGKFVKSSSYDEQKYLSKGEKSAINFTKFVVNYFENIKFIYPEFSIETEYEYVPDVNLKGIIDLLLITESDKLRIIDFKTTSDSEKWYFVYFPENIQKLSYFYLVLQHFKKFPEGFDYLIYNIEKRNIFFQSVNYPEEPQDKEKFFEPLTQRIKIAKYLHFNPDEKYYNPTKNNCKYCDFKNLCPRALK